MGINGISKLGKLSAMKSIRSSAPPMAIDFGVGSLKVIQLTDAASPSLVAAAQLDTPESLLFDAGARLRFQIEALPKVIRSGGFKSQRAVFAIPAGQMFCKHMQVQRIDGVKLDEMVSATIAQQMECNPKALLVRHTVIRDISPGKTEIVCFASGRQLIEQLMGSMKAAKLNPVGIHTEIHALLKGAAVNADSGEAPVIAHIDLGRGTTKVVIARGEEILFARVVPFGGLRLDQAIAKQTQSTIERATERRLAMKSFSFAHAPTPEPAATHVGSAGGSAGGAGGGADGEGEFSYQESTVPSFDLSEPMEIFADELRMCMRYHRSISPSDSIERIVFTGGEARHEALCAHLAHALRLPAQVADPIARVGRSGKEPVSGLTLSEPQPGWAVVMGLALSPTDL